MAEIIPLMSNQNPERKKSGEGLEQGQCRPLNSQRLISAQLYASSIHKEVDSFLATMG